MADLISETFNATTAPSGWTDALTLGGTIDDTSTSSCSLIATATDGSKARRRSPVVSMAVGDTITMRISAAVSFATFIVLRQDTASTSFCPCILASGSNWTSQRYRDSTGYGSLVAANTTRAIASFPWLRFRLATATSVVLEAAPDASGVPGTWVNICTADATNDSLTMSNTTTQLELMCYDLGGTFAGSTVVEQAGDGTGGGSALQAVLRRRRRATL